MMLDQALRRWVCGSDCVACPASTLTPGTLDVVHAIEHTQSPGDVENAVSIGVSVLHPLLRQSARRRAIAARTKAVLPYTGVPNSIDPGQLAAQSTASFDMTEEKSGFM
jgi:hypothetical protein